MKKIALTQGKSALVDDDDFGWLSQWKWQYSAIGYAQRTVRSPRRTTILMHRLILGLRDTLIQADHINGDRLDNRRCNLRPATHSQNQANRTICIANSSGYKGVSWDRRGKKFIARIRINKVQRCLGLFHSAEEASRVYEAKAREIWGEFACTREPTMSRVKER